MKPSSVFLVVLAAALVANAEASIKLKMKAVLFGYIPDAGNDQFAALKSKLTAEFEKLNPTLTAEFVLDANIDLYSLDSLSELYADPSNTVIELDAVMMTDVVMRSWVLQQEYEGGDYLPTAIDAVTIANRKYATPSYVCTNTVYSRKNLAGADTEAKLEAILRDTPISNDNVYLAGNMKGSWTLPVLYLDAFADSTDNGDALHLYNALSVPLQQADAMVPLTRFTNLCALGTTENPCLSGTFKYNTKGETMFAEKRAVSYVGYSENLFNILSLPNTNVQASELSAVLAPVGNGNRPLLFIDALTINARSPFLREAKILVDFLASPSVREMLSFSLDAPQGTPPRYLLQARKDFYTSIRTLADPIYPQLTPDILNRAHYFLNYGYPERKDAVNDAITAQLSGAHEEL